MKDYVKRSIHDNFLKQMPPSINELKKGKESIPKNLRLVVSEDFYNKANNLMDAKFLLGGLELFKKWFVEWNLDTLISNVWEFDIRKLVVLRVYFDSDLLIDMAKKYIPIIKIVKNNTGDNLFKVSPTLIKEVFKLNPNHAIHEELDMEEF